MYAHCDTRATHRNYNTSWCYLLIVGRIPCQVGEVNKLHMEGPKLSQDAATC